MSFLLYGATGYTGTLIAEACAARGIAVVLGGRSAAPLQALATRLGLPHVVVGLDDDAALDAALANVSCVLHCAGPFSRTARPMMQACLRTGRHYLDITGEISIFEHAASLSGTAKARGVMLLPGVGFDVVPSDCLAAHVKRRLPAAHSLELCIAALGTLSHGTATTALESIHEGGVVRRAGKFVRSPPGAYRRTFDLGNGKVRSAVSMPWGDVSTAFHSTGIPDITVYFALPRSTQRLMRAFSLVRPLLALGFVRRMLQARLPQGGPSAEQRAAGSSTIVAEATSATGERAIARLLTPEGYALTVESALLCVARVERGEAPAGFQTPSLAYGPDLVLEVPCVQRVDVVPPLHAAQV